MHEDVIALPSDQFIQSGVAMLPAQLEPLNHITKRIVADMYLRFTLHGSNYFKPLLPGAESRRSDFACYPY
jgi:hypothetical protein